MKTALIHDWLLAEGGAEKVLQEIWNLYPSPIFTLLDGNLMPSKKIAPSVLQKIPGALHFHRYCLPLFPWAIEKFDLADFDLILSSSHAVAKGIRKTSDQLHICYCHTPMRYAWDLEEQYMTTLKGFKKWGAQTVLKYLRAWDLSTTDRVDHFIANSHFVAERIKRIYNRDATVIYPPVATHQFRLAKAKESFYLVVSRLVPYKRVDLIVNAFAKMPGKNLIVVGDGPERKRLQQIPNVKILGYQSPEVVADLMSRARAFIFAAEEDFGIAPVEAQASGTPLIAYGKGGVLETVIESETGLFFQEQSVESLCRAVHDFDSKKFDAIAIKAHAEKFNENRFREAFKSFVDQKWREFSESRHSCRR